MNHNTDLTNYSSIRKHCETASRITADLIDGFLVPFAAKRYDLERKMELQFNIYRHVFSRFRKQDVNLFKSQYIAHGIFKRGGILEKILKHPALKDITTPEREYLERQAEIPWRFSFSEMTAQPENDFFRMRDVFTGEEYLLFSRGTSLIIAEGPKSLWLNLIGFNGACWQCFGPIGAFQSFDSDDIFFFATEKNRDIEEDQQVQDDLDKDPLPYLALISGAAYPRTVSRGFETVVVMTEIDSEAPDSNVMKKKFTIEYNDGIYRYTHKKWGEFPHFAHIYYDEKEEILLFQAMTEHAFDHLVRDFNALGHGIPEIPQVRVHMQMVTTAESILKRKVVINEYEDLFRKDPDPAMAEHTDRMNEFLRLVTPALNEGRDPDIREAALKAGLDPESAAEVVRSVRDMMAKYDKPGLPQAKKVPPEKSTSSEVNPAKPGDSRIVPAKPADRNARIYTAAQQICDLEPWADLYETQNFGVRMPGSGLTWYISVMGHIGEYTAISAYRGEEGFMGFQRLQENAGTFQGMELMTVPHVMISFIDRNELDKKDLSAIKKSGVIFRGKGRWPKLDEVIPGYVPDFPAEETLTQLPDLLEQVYFVLQKAKGNPRLLKARTGMKDEILIRIPRISAGPHHWMDSYEVPTTKYTPIVYLPGWNPESAEKVSKLKLRQVTLQCDLALLPAPVKMTGKKGYFPFGLLLIDKQSGHIAGMSLLSPIPDLDSAYGKFPQKLLEEILKLGFRPERLEFRSKLLFNLVSKVLKQAGCPVFLTSNMPLMDEALGTLFDNLGK